MNAYIKLGVILNALAFVATAITLWSVPIFAAWFVAMCVAIVVQGAGIALLLRDERGRWPLGWVLVGVGGLLMLPIGGVMVYGAVHGFRRHRFGTTIGRKEPEPRPRPRAWTLGAIVFALTTVLSLLWALVYPIITTMMELSQLLVPWAAALIAVIAGIETVMLWQRDERAVRLGVGLSVMLLAVLTAAGFYMHSYLAVAMLPLPLYGLFLVLRGRERWGGFRRDDGPGIEGRGRRTSATA